MYGSSKNPWGVFAASASPHFPPWGVNSTFRGQDGNWPSNYGICILGKSLEKDKKGLLSPFNETYISFVII